MCTQLKIFLKFSIIIFIINVKNLDIIVHASKNVKSNAVASAIDDFIRVFYVAKNIRVDITLFGDVSDKINDIMCEIGKKQNEDYSIRINKVTLLKDKNYLFRESTVIFADKKTIRFLNKRASFGHALNKRITLLIYCNEYAVFEHLHDLKLMSNRIDVHAYFLFKQDNDLLVLTSFNWFSAHRCNEPKLLTYNTFNISNMKWSNELKIIDKFEDFHKCPITIHLRNNYYKIDHRNKITGFMVDVMDIVGIVRNFTPVYTFLPDSHLIIGTNPYYDSIYSVFSPFREIIKRILISPAELFTTVEKILLPFDFTTWIILLSTFGAAIVIITIINYLPKKYQEIVYGEGVSTPVYNLFGVFFGIGQLTLPAANFPRVILMLFIIFCLIFRTAYQGVFFELMTTDMRKPLPQTIQDLSDRNYTYISTVIDKPDPYNFLRATHKGAIIEIPQHMIQKLFETKFCAYLNDPTEKRAFIGSFGNFHVIKEYCRMTPLILNEIVMTIVEGIVMPPYNFLYESVESVTRYLLTAGILQYRFDFYFKQFIRNKIINVEASDKTILTLDDHLGFGFIFWIAACAISLSGFMIEYIMYFIRVKKFKLKKSKTIKVHPINELSIDQEINFKKIAKMFRITKRNVESNSLEEEASEVEKIYIVENKID